MKKVRTENAVGSVLCHDITRIVPGDFKGRAFKKGHIVTEEDVPELLKLGKEHLFVWESKEGYLHEDEAACRLAAAVAGNNIALSEPKEGKVNLLASVQGLLKVDRELLMEINLVDQIVLSTRHENTMVKAGDILAGTRVVPLILEEERIKTVEDLCRSRQVLGVKPLGSYKVGLIITGSEVYHKRIPDAFGPVLERKFNELGSWVIAKEYVPDDTEKIVGAIKTMLANQADLIAISGGMSVDPDDLTPGAIKAAGAEIIGYGAPVLPGSMFLVGYFGKVPVMGLPGCVMYSQASVFDLVVPRILAGERITKKDLVGYAYGGLCLQCEVCRYPVCPFGKG